MLSAFTARPIIELRQRDKHKIETILANGDSVLVGLNTGALRVYRLNDQNGTEANGEHKPTDLLREVERFCPRAIEQLAIVKEASTLVSLSNYHVSLHDLKSYELIETLSRTKNATCFAVTSNVIEDPDTNVPEIISRLAVAVKRKLLLWSWHESELSEELDEIVLAESIRTVTWASATKLVCGMNGGYVMVDAVTREVQDVVGPGAVSGNASQGGSRFGAMSTAGMGYMGLGGYVSKPLSAKLADGQLLLAKDVNTLFITDEGKSLERKQIPWTSPPESIGYSYPYIVALQAPSKGSLEVRNPDTLSLLQSVSLPNAAQLHFPSPALSLVHAAKGFHVSSDRCVWKMDATDYDSQVSELVQGGKYDEAISVLDMLEDALLGNKTETLREAKMLKAELLFRQKKYQQSMDLFNEPDVHAPPERVLRLFPKELVGDLSMWNETDKTNGEETSPIVEGIAKLMGHKRTTSDAASITPKEEDQEGDGPPEGKDLHKAVSELSSFLAGTRVRLKDVIDPVTGQLIPQTGGSPEEKVERFLRTTKNESEKQLEEDLKETFRLVDTTLFKAYMFAKPYLTSSLFRIPNFCDPEVVNEKLLERDQYTELIDFFYGKKLHKEALGLLRRFGDTTKPDEKAPSLHGPDRTIQYLQNLPPGEIDLVLEYAPWTLKANPDYAMDIFIGDTENAETLPRGRVVEFLRGIDSKLEGRYIEHIINELDDMTADFHNRLVELYVKNLKGKRDDEFDGLMVRFVEYLRKWREVYSLGKAFALLPKNDPAFYEAQAVVLSNMGQHRQALEIYVYEMKDYAKAEEYCNRVHKTKDTTLSSPSHHEDEPSIYHTLLSLYLSPPSPHKPLLEPGLSLLSKHGSRLPALSTLDLIPPDLPMHELESYFRGRIRSTTSLLSESRIVAGLRKAEGISVAARLHLGDGERGGQGGRNRHVVISEERHCPVCHKKLAVGGGGRFTTGSVVAVLQDNTVVHYGCLARATGQKETPRAPSWSRGF